MRNDLPDIWDVIDEIARTATEYSGLERIIYGTQGKEIRSANEASRPGSPEVPTDGSSETGEDSGE